MAKRWMSMHAGQAPRAGRPRAAALVLAVALGAACLGPGAPARADEPAATPIAAAAVSPTLAAPPTTATVAAPTETTTPVAGPTEPADVSTPTQNAALPDPTPRAVPTQPAKTATPSPVVPPVAALTATPEPTPAASPTQNAAQPSATATPVPPSDPTPAADPVTVSAVTGDQVTTVGGTARYRFRVRNGGAAARTVRLAASNSAAGWSAEVDDANGVLLDGPITIPAGASLDVLVRVTAPRTARAGDQNATILVATSAS